MTDISLPSYETESRWRFGWLLPVLFRPRRGLRRVAESETAVWHTPIFLLVFFALIQALVAGGLRQAAAASGQIELPPGFEYYTPEQQAQFMQAMTATSGPVFVYLLPAVMSVLGVYLGWLIVGWILHLLLTLLGGRASSRQVLNVAAWAALPFVLRHVVRIGAMWLGGQQIVQVGLSGFVTPEGDMWLVYLATLAGYFDLYFLWHIALLGIGVGLGDNLTRFKGWSAVLVTIIWLHLLRGVPALLAARFSDLTVIRPFF